MASRAITALFDSHDAAAEAVDRIEAEGIPHADIAVVASGSAGGPTRGIDAPAAGPAVAEPVAPTAAQGGEAAEGAGAGATVGTVLGGGAGLLAGLGLIAIPGLGPVVAAGWLVAALTGAGVGAATGGVLGALTGAGLSEADAETYAEGVRRGGTLVTVRADDDRAERVTELLRRSGAIDLDERAQGWRAQGWTGGTATAGATDAVSPPPAAAAPTSAVHEIGSTAIGAAASTTTGLDVESGHTLLPSGEPRPSAEPGTPTRPPPGGIR